jgi:sarcosine oxidase
VLLRVNAVADVVVAGAGILGLSTAWALVERGCTVLLLEQDSIGTTRGGSHGESRVFRIGARDPYYAELARSALDAWRVLEAESGSALLRPTGLVCFGPYLEEIRQAFAFGNVPFEELREADAAQLFGKSVRIDGPALLDFSAGVLAADRCLESLRLLLAASRRCEVHLASPVIGIESTADEAEVVTADGARYAGDSVVCCTGAWTPALVREIGLSLPVTPQRVQVGYFPTAERNDEWPILMEWSDRSRYMVPTGRGGLCKLGLRQEGTDMTAADLESDGELDAVLSDRIAGSIHELVPEVHPSDIVQEICLYDNTPDREAVIDRFGRVVVAAGTSGQGFKFAPMLGRFAAQLATEGVTELTGQRFRLDRSSLRTPDPALLPY